MKMLQLEHILMQVQGLAIEAGRRLVAEREQFDISLVERKGAHDFVSYVDRKSEEFITHHLHIILPEAGFIVEEGSRTFNGEPYCWVVDPLDGTTNFIHNQWPYCVSIALRDSEKILLGVIYDPIRNECFYSMDGCAAYLNDTVIHVSPVNDLKDACIHLGFPYNSTAYRPIATDLVNRLYGHCAGLRLQGSAAMELCQVAAGRMEARIEAYLGPWDIAAGSIILSNAGGRISSFDGSPDCLDARSVVASNDLLHDSIIDITKHYTI